MDSAQQQQEQPQNIHEQSQEEYKIEEEEENKKVGDGFGNNLDISIQREKKNLDGANDRTISRDVQTQQYLDSLIKGNVTNLNDGLSRAIDDYFSEYRRYPDVDYNELIRFADNWLGLIDVPPKGLRNLMRIIRELRENIQAETEYFGAIEPEEMIPRIVEDFNSLDQTMWNNQDEKMENVLDEKARLNQHISLTSEQDYMHNMNLDTLNLDGDFYDDVKFSIDPKGLLLDESQDKRSEGPVAVEMNHVRGHFVQGCVPFRGLLPIVIRMTWEPDLESFMQQLDRPGSLTLDLYHTILSKQFRKPEDHEQKDEANKKQKRECQDTRKCI